MKKTGAALSVMAIAAAALIMAATTASFSDRVTTGEDSFTAGTLLMSVDGQCGTRVYGGVPGDPGMDGNQGCELEGVFEAGPMAPGDPAEEFTFEITNVGNLDGVLTATDNPVISATHEDCEVSDFTVTTDTLTGVLLEPGQPVNYHVTVQLDAEAPNVCQGASLTLNIAFDLVQS